MDIPENIESKVYILDPLSVVIKLAIISNKPPGVKLCIFENILYIHEIHLLQSTIRYWYKINKGDISYLYNPIEFACQYFLDEGMVERIPNIVNLFKSALKGLAKLTETYKNYAVIIHCLSFYANIIQNHLNYEINPTLFRKDFITPYYTTELLSEFNKRWDEDKLKIVLDMITFLNSDGTPNKNVRCLEIFMEPIDANTKLILSNFN